MKIGIIGAGLAGLSVAYFLKDFDVTIFEKEEEIGGLCRSKQKNGFTYDIGGSHILFSKDKEVLSIILELLSENIERKRRNTKILYNGRLVKYPFENGLGDLDKIERIECLEGYIDALLKRKDFPEPPENLYDWIYWRFGKGFAEKYMIPYNEKIWKYDLRKMSSSWVHERVPEPSITELLKAALELESEGYVHQLYYWYPKHGGIEALIQSLAKYAKIIYRNQVITKIKREGKKWVVISNGKKFEFDVLINTIHVKDFLTLLQEDVPENVIKAAENLITNGLINIFIGIEGNVKEKYQGLSWLYVPSWEQGYFHRISFPTTFSEYNAPEGYSGINIEITAMKGSELWTKSDDEIINDVTKLLQIKLNMIEPEQIKLVDITRWDHAYVIFDLQYHNNVKTIYNYLDKIGVYYCGRFAEFLYLNMDHTIKHARACANKIQKEISGYKGN